MRTVVSHSLEVFIRVRLAFLLRMNSLVFFFVLATVALIQGQNSTNQDGKPFLKSCFNAPRTHNALENLMTSKPIQIQVSPFCSTQDMEDGAVNQGRGDKLRFYNPTAVCRLGLPQHPRTREASRTVLKVYTCREPSLFTLSCGDGPSSAALFLPYSENKNTYMKLNASRAHWFFTTALGGCDIFIATRPGHPKEPLIVHANRNNCSSDHLANFREKGEGTDEIVPGLATGYELKARVHVKRQSTPQLTTYWSTYRAAHNNIPLTIYKTENPDETFNFFGQYQAALGWRFFLKAITKGKLKNVMLLP